MLSYTGSVRNNEWESSYGKLVSQVLHAGELRKTRNGNTRGIFGATFTLEDTGWCALPLLERRKMYPTGIVGEMAAFLSGPKTVQDFEKFGCNYWKLWGKPDGSISVDYGNKWLDFHGVNQIEQLVEGLKSDPNGRRHLITGWDPSNLGNLDLPCCHYAYQWYVRGNYLDMIWHQRSADLMIGVPSDIALAVLLNHLVANAVGLTSGTVSLVLGDVHIYEEHVEGAKEYLDRFYMSECYRGGSYKARLVDCASVLDFKPEMVKLAGYDPADKIDFLLKS